MDVKTEEPEADVKPEVSESKPDEAMETETDVATSAEVKPEEIAEAPMDLSAAS